MLCGTQDGEEERFLWDPGTDSRRIMFIGAAYLKGAWFSVSWFLYQVQKTTDHPRFLICGSSQVSELHSLESCLGSAAEDSPFDVSAFLSVSPFSLWCGHSKKSFLVPNESSISSLLWNQHLSQISKTNLFLLLLYFNNIPYWFLNVSNIHKSRKNNFLWSLIVKPN